jgi:acylphosphatase
MKSAEILVTGKVQGVWFRDFVRKTGKNLELYGWVKNNPDSSVSVLVEGNNDAIKLLIDKIRIGSPMSKVEDVKINWLPYENKFNSFKIIR